jgi:outer membrane PBP1 activator LpoA protein
MQRALVFPLLVGWLLCLGACALGNDGALAQQPEATEADRAGAHIAVLLPLKSSALARPAEAVRRGVWEAHRVHSGNGLPLLVHATGDDPFDIVQAYEQAVQAGARLVIGPLTRSAVTALAGSNLVSVPTLALNAPETDAPLPQSLYVFGLQVENEARQLAQLAAEHGRRRALVISAESALSKRLSQGFTEEWTRRGNKIAEEFAFTTDPGELGKLRDTLALGAADMVFLALDAKQAKLIRSYLGLSMPIYATSLVHTGSDPLARLELNGVYFTDMPWLLAPDHPAVLSYARPDPAGMEFQRFYALGIDAYRIAQELAREPGELRLDGVTGHITLDRDHRLVREPIPAQFQQGETKVLADGDR